MDTSLLLSAALKRLHDGSQGWALSAVMMPPALTRGGICLRLNHRLERACRKTIQKLCPDACAKPEDAEGCGGMVLNCLVEKVADITMPACQRVRRSPPLLLHKLS